MVNYRMYRTISPMRMFELPPSSIGIISVIMCSEKSDFHFCYYPIPNTDEFINVKLRKSCNCTAFKTWEACFAFLEWAVDHPTEFSGKTVLEVGSGSGLCGMMLDSVMSDCSVIMSDYCEEVTEYLLGNIDRSTFDG